jgi:ribosomal protein S18 acetylase RimI-like enzyme
MEIEIRRAQPADCGVIAEYNRAMARETEGIELDAERVRAGVQAVLDDPAKGAYWVALRQGEVLGQLLLTYEWSDWRNGVFWWVQSVYVRPDARRQGVFRHLYRHVREQAAADPGVCGIRLYVEEHNRRAQDTYLRQGMKRTPYLVFEEDFVLKRT